MDMWPCCSDYILREKHVALYIDWFKITSTSSVADYESKKTNSQFISETHIYPTMTALGICTKTLLLLNLGEGLVCNTTEFELWAGTLHNWSYGAVSRVFKAYLKLADIV